MQTTGKVHGIHYLARAAILTCLATLILHLAVSGNLIYYIAPRMNGYAEWSTAILYSIAIYQLYVGIRSFWGDHFVACDCDHLPSKSIFRSTIVYSFFLLPLALGFFLPNTVMSSSLAEQKGMNLNISTPTTQPGIIIGTDYRPDPRTGQTLEPVPPTDAANAVVPGTNVSDEQLQKMFAPPDEFYDDFSKMGMVMYKRDVIRIKPEIYTEMLTALDLYKSNFVGKKIEISGFVYRPDDLNPNQLVVGRFAVSCCTADATPYGMLVEFPKADTFAKDAWIQVTGTIGKTDYQGNTIIKVDAASIKNIAAPETPYVYPNIDPLAELNK